MTPFKYCLALTMLTAFIGGCQLNRDCGEFAPPPDRVMTHCPPVKTPTPAQAAAEHKRYCYGTLGQPDCYDTPQPQLAPTFLGTYPN